MDSSSLITPAGVAQPTSGRAQTAGYFAAFIALGLVAASLGPTLPYLAAQTDADLKNISYLFTTRSAGYLLGSLLGGRIYDRVRGNPVFATSLLAMALLMGGAPAVSPLALLVAVLLLIGVAEGFIDVGANTLIVWLHRERVGPLMNGLHFCFGLGAFLSPLLVALAVSTSGWYGWAYWSVALSLMPLGLWFTRLWSPVAPTLAADDPQGQINWPLVGLISSCVWRLGFHLRGAPQAVRRSSGGLPRLSLLGRTHGRTPAGHAARLAAAPTHDLVGRPALLHSERRLYHPLARVAHRALARHARPWPGHGVDLPNCTGLCRAAHGT